MSEDLSREADSGSRALDPLLDAARSLVRGRKLAWSSRTLDHTSEKWRKSLERIVDEASGVHERLEQDLETASSRASFDAVRETLAQLVEDGERAVGRIRSLVGSAERLREEWDAEHRYTAEGLAARREQLDAMMVSNARSGAQAWLQELLDAADAGEEEAAASIASMDLPWPEELRAGAERLASAFRKWREDGALPAIEPLEELIAAKGDGWADILTPALRSRAHRFAAWVALRKGDTAGATEHMEAAVELYPYAGWMHAERSALRLFLGDFDRAVTDAQHSIEIAPQEPAGYLMLGIWAELTGKFSTADDLYRRAFQRMPTAEVASLHERSALIDPPGRLLKIAAGVLLESGRPRRALEVANEALLSGLRGMEPHPEADVYLLRRKALERLPESSPSAVAEAAIDAGKLCIWNGDVDCAIDELGHGAEFDATGEAGWLLADAFLTKSFPLGAQAPDQKLVARARSVWETTSERAGLPHGRLSWAYVTRAIVADLESQRPDTDRRRPALFEALMYVEKALVHNHTDGQRWAYVAQFLRYLGLELLAFEAADAGYRLAAADRQVLAERLPLLANRREFDEAEAVCTQLVAMYGEDPWVSAVRAWLALHHDRDSKRALELLRLPLAEGNEQAWYRELQAQAELLAGRVEVARESYRGVLDAEALDGNTKCRLARASLALGKLDDAQAWLETAAKDTTTPPGAYLMTAALRAAAAGDAETAARRLEEAIRLASSSVEIDDILFEAALAAQALEANGQVAATKGTFVDATKNIVAAQKAALERNPPSPDAELERALAELPDGSVDTPAVALLALGARRDVSAGRHAAALARYEQLRDTPFEPEASIALEHLGRLAAAEHQPTGDVTVPASRP
jgi:predicted Zn-dependent protease